MFIWAILLDFYVYSGYNVTTMASIRTKLVRDGNSTSVRIPKTLLEMSGLSGMVEIEASRGIVTIRETKNPRAGWAEAIQKADAQCIDPELADWDALAGDSLGD